MPRMEHSRPVLPRGRFCAWKPPRLVSSPVSTAVAPSSWKHGRNSCYRGTFQEASPAYLWSDFGVVVIITVHP